MFHLTSLQLLMILAMAFVLLTMLSLAVYSIRVAFYWKKVEQEREERRAPLQQYIDEHKYVNH